MVAISVRQDDRGVSCQRQKLVQNLSEQAGVYEVRQERSQNDTDDQSECGTGITTEQAMLPRCLSRFHGLLTPPSAGTGMLLNILAAAEVVFGASMNVAVV
jgi:hypothetical protein